MFPSVFLLLDYLPLGGCLFYWVKSGGIYHYYNIWILLDLSFSFFPKKLRATTNSQCSGKISGSDNLCLFSRIQLDSHGNNWGPVLCFSAWREKPTAGFKDQDRSCFFSPRMWSLMYKQWFLWCCSEKRREEFNSVIRLLDLCRSVIIWIIFPSCHRVSIRDVYRRTNRLGPDDAAFGRVPVKCERVGTLQTCWKGSDRSSRRRRRHTLMNTNHLSRDEKQDQTKRPHGNRREVRTSNSTVPQNLSRQTVQGREEKKKKMFVHNKISHAEFNRH